MVIADRMGQRGHAIARYFSEAMGLGHIKMVHEANFSVGKAGAVNLLFIGLPDQPEALGLFPTGLALAPRAFTVERQRFGKLGDVLFTVASHADYTGRIVALLHPLSAEAADQAALKIPHYGRYRYLAFSNGRNRIKGAWKVNHLEQHPDQVMVLLAGSGHARKMVIPYQIKSRLPIPFAVLLPHTPNIFGPATLTRADAGDRCQK